MPEPTLYRALGLSDGSRALVGTVGQTVVYDAVTAQLAQWNEDITALKDFFTEEDTENWQDIYKMPGSGKMQRTGNDPAGTAAIATIGSWDTDFPLEGYRDAIALGDVAAAYLTIRDMQLQFETVTQRALDTRRDLIIRAMMSKTNRSFKDMLDGGSGRSLTIRRLANADGTDYPPLVGLSAVTSAHTHYLTTNNATIAAGAANPFKLIFDHLDHHFSSARDTRVVVMIHEDEEADTRLLADFNPVQRANLINKTDETVLSGSGLPSVPGDIIGTWKHNVYIAVWNYIPSGYCVGIALDQPRPLRRRVDVSESGIQPGLQVIPANLNSPLEGSYYRIREGYGVANRLNGVCVFVDAGAVYTDPTFV